MALATWTDSQIIAQLDSGSKWVGSRITYSFATNSSAIYTGSGEGSGFTALNAAQQAAATRALLLWDDVIAPDMVRAASGTNYASSNLEFGTSTTGIGYAHAYYPGVGSVWFNSSYGAGSGTNDLVSPKIGNHGFLTYIHEIGHALGLDHMGAYNGSQTSGPSSYQDSTVYSVMSYYGPSWGGGSSAGEGLVAWADWVGTDGRLYAPQTPMLNDIMAMQAMYGVETTTRIDNTVYGFSSTVTGTQESIFNFTLNKNPIICIFDSAGIDTLNLSGWSTSSIIDLAPGGFSSGNGMTMNISIAYTCNIENAVGGAGADTISGNSLANRLSGGAGNDRIYGLLGNDVLNGQDGDDLLDGGVGADTMSGGAGNDTYVVDNVSDRVNEGLGGGIDTVRTTLTTYTLAVNVENLEYTGAGAAGIKVVGNSLANVIKAGAGNDYLNGGLGADDLRGNAGTDYFQMTTALGTSNVDLIRDFNCADDTILLENAIFRAFGAATGTLAAGAFNTGSAAREADDRIIFNTGTGGLAYDSDGTGAAAAVQFAILDLAGLNGTVSAADFFLI
ncbi:MAG: M10 family metallopeptidase [Hyphomicrobiaceae bacterium]